MVLASQLAPAATGRRRWSGGDRLENPVDTRGPVPQREDRAGLHAGRAHQRQAVRLGGLQGALMRADHRLVPGTGGDAGEDPHPGGLAIVDARKPVAAHVVGRARIADQDAEVHPGPQVAGGAGVAVVAPRPVVRQHLAVVDAHDVAQVASVQRLLQLRIDDVVRRRQHPGELHVLEVEANRAQRMETGHQRLTTRRDSSPVVCCISAITSGGTGSSTWTSIRARPRG